jgi:hypothetical protein
MMRAKYFSVAKKLRIAGLIALPGVVLFVVLLQAVNTEAQSGINYSLRFYGHGVNQIDRVKISINPPVPADVGAEDFTLEFWMKANALQNTAGAVSCGANIGWINGNIVFDRDRYGQDRKFGLSIAGGKFVFGVSGQGTGDRTICGTTNVLDNQWHHVAIQRRRSDGWMWLFVDGNLQAQVDGPDGDISYPDSGVPCPNCCGGGSCAISDPFLVIAAEKHDAGAIFPSYSGIIDEVRLSKTLRYSSNNFVPLTTPFAPDANTVALYHFDGGPAGPCTGTVQDSSGASGGPSNGTCNYGGSSPAGPVYTTDTPFAGPLPTPTPDTTPPVITQVTADPLDTVAIITWNTDEPATSWVEYGIDPTLNMRTTETSVYVTSHLVILTNLIPSTPYVYRVYSRDATGNISSSTQFSFSVLSPEQVNRTYLPVIFRSF